MCLPTVCSPFQYLIRIVEVFVFEISSMLILVMCELLLTKPDTTVRGTLNKEIYETPFQTRRLGIYLYSV